MGRIPPINKKIPLESDPLNSRVLVRRLAVLTAHVRGCRGRRSTQLALEIRHLRKGGGWQTRGVEGMIRVLGFRLKVCNL